MMPFYLCRALMATPILLAGCGGDPAVATGGGAGGHATHTTTSASTSSSTSTTTAPACSAAACVEGSYGAPYCDLGSKPAPCCQMGAASTECVLPAGVVLHSKACDAICPGPSASCALSPMGTLTCCSPGGPFSACNEVVP